MPYIKINYADQGSLCRLKRGKEHLSQEFSGAKASKKAVTGETSGQNLKENLLSHCRIVAGSNSILAACIYGSQSYEHTGIRSEIKILLVLGKSRFGLKFHARSLRGIDVFILAVDQKTFEKDVKQGLLGDFIAEKITIPYEPLANEEYLQLQEVRAKKRIVSELLENIVSEYPELSYEILVKMEYFILEVARRRIRLLPLMVPTYLNLPRGYLKQGIIDSVKKGYVKALNELIEEGLIISVDGFFRIRPDFIDAVKRRRSKIPIYLKMVQRTASYNILSIFPSIMTLLFNEEGFTGSQSKAESAHMRGKSEAPSPELEDPRNYLLMQTPLGLVTLSDKTTIEDFTRKTISDRKASDFKIQRIGGVLNDVYLLSFRRDGEEQKFLVKRFRDWSGIKWLPLTLWALGTKKFAVLGRSRLEREVAANKFLQAHCLCVPKILHVSPKKRLIFEEFIEGENIVEIIRQAGSFKKRASLMSTVGRKLAEIHGLDMALGDCKPENVLFTGDGKVWFVDLEQATRSGNQEWDVAEFLYYSGHFVSPLRDIMFSSPRSAEQIAKEFITGYLEAGGKRENVRKAASPKYTKVFSVFTPPHILIALSNLCRNI